MLELVMLFGWLVVLFILMLAGVILGLFGITLWAITVVYVTRHFRWIE